jgi:purine-binding chemotaxis protein CheW
VPSTVASAFLVLRAGAHRVAFPAGAVVEVLRVLPLRPVAGAPGFVEGLCRIRGMPVPVVDLACLLSGTAGTGAMLVSLRTGTGGVAVRVDRVEGIARLDPAAAVALPSLASTARPDLVETVARLDGDLLLVLRAARILLPGEVPAPAAGEAP